MEALATDSTTPRATLSPTPSLLALVLGAALGILAHYSGNTTLLAAIDTLEPVGFLWMRALRMLVLPLVVSTLVVAILNGSRTASAGKVGSVTLVAFIALLCAGGAYSYGLGSLLVEWLPRGAGAAISLAPESATALAAGSEPLSFSQWLGSLIPVNPFNALSEGQLLPVILFTVAFSLALARVEGPGRETVRSFFEAVFTAMMTLVRWVLVVAPPAIFILALSFAAEMGWEFTSILVNFVVMECGLLILATLLLYPLTSVLSGISPLHFARGVLPAQLVALSTRSSLASLPALLEGARERLSLRPAIADLALPLAVSVFKINRPISSMFSFLLLAHLFAIDLSATQVITFFVTTMILSFSSVGIPLGGNAMLSLPVYLAAGIPIEGYLLLKTVDSVTDIFKTVINVTGDMSVAAILDRRL